VRDEPRRTIPLIIITSIDLAIGAVFPIIPMMLPARLFGHPLPK
jgi:hypothetical protein